LMWFTETSWPPLLFCLVLSAGLFARWTLTKRGSLLALSAAFLLIAGAVVAVERLIVTQSERVEEAIYGLAKAFQAGDIGGCADFFSPQDPADRELVRQAAGMVKIEGPIRISDLSVTMSSAESRAVAVFRASADASFNGHHDRARTRWELTWQREGDEWKIIRVRRLSFLGDGEIKQPLTAAE
jgi:ketosteroid isomerase-like protein